MTAATATLSPRRLRRREALGEVLLVGMSTSPASPSLLGATGSTATTVASGIASARCDLSRGNPVPATTIFTSMSASR